MSFFRALLNMFAMAPRYLLSRSVQANICITEHVLQRHRLPSSQRIYYGIEGHDVPAPIQLSGEPLARKKPCFAFVGRFVPEKGIAVLLKAAQHLLSEGFTFEILLIGDGPQRGELENLIAQYGLGRCVQLPGFIPNSNLRETLSRASAMVMPSVWEETAGLAAIEQMMEGRLVIASEVGGLGEIVRDGGLLFPVGDSIALAQRMKAVLTNPALIDEFGSAARRKALDLFLCERMVREHAQLYMQLVEKKGA